MSAKQRAPPTIGTIFSSDSSDSDYAPINKPQAALKVPRSAKTSASSGSERPKKVSIRLANYHSNDDRTPRTAGGRLAPPALPENVPEGYIPLNKTRAGTIAVNSLIQYENASGTLVKPKYFKKVDTIAGTIIVGFFKNNRRNYSEKLDKIKTLYVQQAGGENGDQLRETIELPQDQWKSIRRDMIISYEKDTGEYIYKAKFNAFVKGTDESSKMSLTSERGFNYIANPSKMKRIFRHITSNDKTLTVILETLRKLEIRVRQLEQKQRK